MGEVKNINVQDRAGGSPTFVLKGRWVGRGLTIVCFAQERVCETPAFVLKRGLQTAMSKEVWMVHKHSFSREGRWVVDPL